MSRGPVQPENEYKYYGYYGRVIESITLNTIIGSGKSNTTAMMSIERSVTVGGVASTEKAYIQGPQLHHRGATEYAETVWYVCDRYNKRTYMESNTTGCDDWYIPSFYEVGQLILCFYEDREELLEFFNYYPFVFTSTGSSRYKVDCVGTDENYTTSEQPRYEANSILVLVRSF